MDHEESWLGLSLCLFTAKLEVALITENERAYGHHVAITEAEGDILSLYLLYRYTSKLEHV